MEPEVALPQPVFPKVRRWPRLKLNIPLRVIAQKRDKTAIVEGRGKELNEGGLAVFAGIELAVDDVIAVEFTPPYSGQPIRVRALVRNRSGYNYGVEFLKENDDDIENAAQIRSVLRGHGSMLH
jgi:hypothetical protein